MRLAVVTDEIGEDLRAALDVCDDLGVARVELRSVDGKNVVDHPAESLDRIRALLAERRIRVCAIASPFLKCNPDEIEDHRRIFERSLDVARFLGAPLVRTFSFWRVADPPGVHAQLCGVLREAGRAAAGAGLRLVLENEYDCNVATSAEAADILRDLAPRELGLIWDPANAARFRPEEFRGLGGYDAIRDRVAHVHLKDVDPRAAWVRIGRGIVDHAALLAALSRDGYSGCISIETHYTVDGSSEKATRECVRALRATADRAGVRLML